MFARTWEPRLSHVRIPLQTGVERKATCRALFSKLLYLAESEELLPGTDAGTRRSLVADVFGATEDDAAQLRIVSLYEVRQIVWATTSSHEAGAAGITQSHNTLQNFG